MNRIVLAGIAALASLVPAPSPAQTSTAPVVFTTVDAVKVDHNELVITGVVQGESAASDRTFYFNFSTAGSFNAPWEQRQSCERLALISQAKPGQYLFEVEWQSYGYPKCRLSRVTP